MCVSRGERLSDRKDPGDHNNYPMLGARLSNIKLRDGECTSEMGLVLESGGLLAVSGAGNLDVALLLVTVRRG